MSHYQKRKDGPRISSLTSSSSTNHNHNCEERACKTQPIKYTSGNRFRHDQTGSCYESMYFSLFGPDLAADTSAVHCGRLRIDEQGINALAPRDQEPRPLNRATHQAKCQHLRAAIAIEPQHLSAVGAQIRPPLAYRLIGTPGPCLECAHRSAMIDSHAALETLEPPDQRPFPPASPRRCP